MPDVFVKSFSHLKDRPHADKALPLLQRIASLVKPIMRKHGWVLPVLSEFFPADNNLLGLNINHGQKILVRLRPAHAPDTFYDEEDVLHTMLHELTHNVHGPHDEKFYKYLSGLEEELEALRKSGYSGEGFHSAGTRLGANVSHDVPPHIAKQKALEAAEKRRQISAILGGGGRIGGTIHNNKSPRELAAEAAERRARDEKACASGAVAQAEAAKAEQESIQDDVIDLTGDDSDSSPEPEIIVIDDEVPSASAPTQPSGGASGSGYSSSSSASISGTSSGSRTPASWSGLRPGSALESSSSSLSTLSGHSAATSTPGTPGSSSHPPLIRPTVRRVERGAGPGTPTLPKPRSRSRVATHAHTLLHSPATPPPTRTNSIANPHHHHHPHADAPAVVPPLEKEWACPRCTLINDALALQCSACLLLRPGLADGATALDAALAAVSGAGDAGAAAVRVGKDAVDERGTGAWTCHVCGEGGMPHDFWTCRYCGSVKVRS
ncbi:DNA-dependent metalloprotease WSS1 [Trametes pubescens]|uniref:DNA-dependent metalloprotease WSS1 n=1 Tax=Trametes pubescens TaxID=154538 RepID=A0A1M2VAF9_TRAPU|nr:DNA-dependent metalloprotease WSS1 [Trametes pubescens]